MLRASRKLAFLALAVALVSGLSGCGSNNKGKIEGKWKLVSAPGFDDQVKMLDAMKAYVTFEFTPDGNLLVGAGSENAFLDKVLADKMAASTELPKGKYKLLSGDQVEFSGMSDKQGAGFFGKSDATRLKVNIDGDNMTMTGTDGTAKLVRLKPGTPAGGAAAGADGAGAAGGAGAAMPQEPDAKAPAPGGNKKNN